MSPIIHFVRHAQGYHNLNTANHSIHDPLLTPYGEQQCRLLSETFPYTREVDMIVASPLKRTIYTALLSFPNKRLPIVALPELQETSDLPCDTGSRREELEREFRGQNVDLSLVGEGWNSKLGRWAPTRPAITERSREARKWLRERKEDHIVVVTHGGVLHYLTEDWGDYEDTAGTGWVNTEYRSYFFDHASGANCSLIETEESKTRRRGVEKPLSEAERRNLRQVSMREQENREFQKIERQEDRRELRQDVRQAVLHEDLREARREERREDRREPLRMLAKLNARKVDRDWVGF